MPVALSVSGLRRLYGHTVAVDDISFEVRRNEIVGLLGPNGAGKTTTINMILGVLSPSAGAIRIEGIDLARHRSRAVRRTNFAAVYAPLPGNLTVSQNLRVFGLMYGVTDLSRRIEAILDELDIARLRNTRCGTLSSGEQTRVSLAKAMLSDPRLLLLDEPTASLDPAAAHDVRAKIRDFARRGTVGVLWTSHNMYEVADFCDRVLFLSRGRILLEGDPKTLPREHGMETLEALFIAVAREPLVLSSTGTSAVGLAAMLALAYAFFGLSFAAVGLPLVPFLLVLFLSGIALGIFGAALVLRLGPASEWLVWPIPAFISPFAAVFYPLSALPGWMQAVSRLLPPAYVFEGMRAIVEGRPFPGQALLWSALLAVLYIVAASWFFARVHRSIVRSGLLARYSAESMG